MKNGKTRKPRPFVGVYFSCCNAYRRLYVEPEKKEYRLACPKCRRWAVFVADRNAPPGRFIEVG